MEKKLEDMTVDERDEHFEKEYARIMERCVAAALTGLCANPSVVQIPDYPDQYDGQVREVRDMAVKIGVNVAQIIFDGVEGYPLI